MTDAPKKKAPVKKPTKEVFYSMRPDLMVQIRNKDYVFHRGKLEVDKEVGDLLRAHTHYHSGQIVPANEAIILNGRLEARKDHKDLLSLLEENPSGYIFRYNLGPHTKIAIRGKDVVFDNHFAVVDEAQAEALRNHTFLNLGKISEVNVELQ